MALPLIPLDEIECAFGKIVNEAPRSMKPLIQYFNGYWMTKVKWTLWNVSDVDIRSNNMVEGEFVPFSCLFYFWVHPFSSPLFRTSGYFVGCSESTIEHNIIFADVRNENRSGVRNEKYRMFGIYSDRCSEQNVTDVRNEKLFRCSK
jgi:hypothetical protein